MYAVRFNKSVIFFLVLTQAIVWVGPPGQVAAISGPKDGLAQGELGGALKDLGYIKEQVSVAGSVAISPKLIASRRYTSSSYLRALAVHLYACI